jgi:hypothetical protein
MVEGIIVLAGAYMALLKIVQGWREFDERYGLKAPLESQGAEQPSRDKINKIYGPVEAPGIA